MTSFANRSGESEQAVIGAVMLNSSWLTETSLCADHFQSEKHRIIWSAVEELISDRQPVDLVTLDSVLKAKGLNYTVYLAEIGRHTPSIANAKAYADAVIRYSGLSRTLQAIDKARANILAGENVSDALISDLMALDVKKRSYEHGIKEFMGGAIQNLEDRRAGLIKPISTGIQALNKILGGFHDSDLIVIAGRPAMGKTAVMINMALACDGPVGIISGEQPADQIGGRMLSIAGSIQVERMRNASLNPSDYEKLSKTMGVLVNKNNIHINDQPSPSIIDIQRQARKWSHTYGLKALFIDYIQRIEGGNPKSPKHERVGEIVRGLKSLARELNIPVIALAQVNRKVEERQIKVPFMGDIADSSEIEKEADQIITLYRDEVYNEKTANAGIMLMTICKNRHGATGSAECYWIGEFMQLKDKQNPGW